MTPLQYVPLLLSLKLILVNLPSWLWSRSEGSIVDGLVTGKITVYKFFGEIRKVGGEGSDKI
jgi:hypothetical protein